MSKPTSLFHLFTALVFASAAGCAGEGPNTDQGADDPIGGKADGETTDLLIEELQFHCEANCTFDECISESDKTAVLAELDERFDYPFILVPTSAKAQWRFDNPCWNDDLFEGLTYDGFTAEVAIVGLPFDASKMDWELCETEVDDFFRKHFDRDIDQIGGNTFPQLLEGSTLGTIVQGEVETVPPFARYEVEVLDENGDAYFRYFARFNQGCIATSSGDGFI